MLGLNREQAVGKSCSDIFGDGDITRAVQETIEQKDAFARMEAMLDRPAGTHVARLQYRGA